MHLFKGLEGNRVNLFEKGPKVSEKFLAIEDTEEQPVEVHEVKAQSATRLRSLDGRIKRREEENHSLNKISKEKGF